MKGYQDLNVYTTEGLFNCERVGRLVERDIFSLLMVMISLMIFPFFSC